MRNRVETVAPCVRCPRLLRIGQRQRRIHILVHPQPMPSDCGMDRKKAVKRGRSYLSRVVLEVFRWHPCWARALGRCLTAADAEARCHASSTHASISTGFSRLGCAGRCNPDRRCQGRSWRRFGVRRPRRRFGSITGDTHSFRAGVVPQAIRVLSAVACPSSPRRTPACQSMAAPVSPTFGGICDLRLTRLGHGPPWAPCPPTLPVFGGNPPSANLPTGP